VENGTGLAGWHGGIADSFRASSDYLHLVGGQFATHPALPAEQRPGGEADNYLTHTIHITDDHPVVAGIENFELTTEQYWVLTDDLIDVHATTTHPARADQPRPRELTRPAVCPRARAPARPATTTQPAREDQPWHREMPCPAVWTRQWGAGRIFVATPGHSVDVLEHPSVRTIVERGLLWAAR